jgi:hypothetical protein
MNGKYDDIINLERPLSLKHPRMPISDRAAQFAPFAALTGYDDAIDETGRYTDNMAELSEDAKELLDRKQIFLSHIIDEKPEITVTYFVPDAKKSGGEYKTICGKLKAIDEYKRELVLFGGTRIPTFMIRSIDGEVLDSIAW